MFLRRPFFPLAVKHSQGADDARTRFLRFDDAIDLAVFGCFIGRRKFIDIFLFLLFFFRVVLKDDIGCTIGAHDGDFCRRPGHDHVGAELAAAHGNIGTAVGLAGDDGDLGDRRFTVSIEHLGTVADDAAVFLSRPRQEARYIDEGDDRDIEAVAEADETSRLVRCVDIQAAGKEFRLVGDDTDGLAVKAGEAGDDIEGIVSRTWKTLPSSTQDLMTSSIS